MGSPINLKSIFEYNNYRDYIRDYYLTSKARDKKFSHRYFARLAGFKSSNFIKFIIDNKSNISPASAEALASAMKLKKNESNFFAALVKFNQATNSEERHRFAEELLRHRNLRKIFPLREALFNYTSKWYLCVLRALVGLTNFVEDPEGIASSINKGLTAVEVRRGFEDLVQLKLLHRDENGRLHQTAADVASDDEVALSSVAQFHREMMTRASECIDSVPRERRDISGITLGVSLETARQIKNMIKDFRRQVVEVASQDTGTQAVYQLNIQLFPLIEIKDNLPKPPATDEVDP